MMRHYSILYADGRIGHVTTVPESLAKLGLTYADACQQKIGSRVVGYVPLSVVSAPPAKELPT